MSTRSSGPFACTPPPRSNRAWGEARGDLLGPVRDQHQGRGCGIGGQAGQVGYQHFPAPQVQRGGRLVQKHYSGVGHQAAGYLHPLALAR